MCTISWLPTADGYELLFNRDESRRRQPASPPSHRLIDGIEVLAPTDGDFGGTWISLNSYGWCVALLNRYQDHPATSGPFTSRGLLVLDLASSHSLEDVERRLQQRDIAQYRPFTLVLSAPPGLGQTADGQTADGQTADGQTPLAWTIVWDGLQRSTAEPVLPPIASSGYVPESIQEERRQVYELMRGEGASLLDFHRSHRPARGPFSPCMHRPDASTVSLLQIVVDREHASMAYAPGPPCRTPLDPPLTIPRRSRTAQHG